MQSAIKIDVQDITKRAAIEEAASHQSTHRLQCLSRQTNPT
jgi:hypothetical protein